MWHAGDGLFGVSLSLHSPCFKRNLQGLAAWSAANCPPILSNVTYSPYLADLATLSTIHSTRLPCFNRLLTYTQFSPSKFAWLLITTRLDWLLVLDTLVEACAFTSSYLGTASHLVQNYPLTKFLVNLPSLLLSTNPLVLQSFSS